MVKKGASEKIFQTCLLFICSIMVAVCIIPMLNVLATSLSDPEFIRRNQIFLLPRGLTVSAYLKVLSSGAFVHSLFYTILLTILYTVLALAMTVLCAYPLSKRNLKGRKFFLVFIVFTMYFDAGIIPNYLVVKQLGMLDTSAALVIPIVLSAYNMIIMRNFFLSIDNSILESAYLEGCSEFQTLLRIVVPLSKAVIATLALFYAVGRWNSITDVVYYITDPNKQTLQGVLKEIIMNEQASKLDAGQTLGMQKTITDSVRDASVILSMIPILCIYPFVQKYFAKGIMLGSVKG